jgi:hypothetical protein
MRGGELRSRRGGPHRLKGGLDMQVHVADIRRSDWVRSIPYVFVRLRVNWVIYGIVAAVIFAVLVCVLVVDDLVNFRWVAFVAVFAVVGGLVVMLVGLLCHLASIAAMAKKAGLLHPFSLTLGEDGLRTQSARGEGLLKWSAVAFVKRNKKYIFVGVTPYTFLLIPLRMLQSPQESEAFWVRMCDLWRASAQGA